MSFKDDDYEYMYTGPLAASLVLGITFLLGSLLALDIRGILFGLAVLFFPLISGEGVIKLVINKPMVKTNKICITAGSLFMFSAITFSDGFFIPYIITLMIWGLYFLINFDEITQEEPRNQDH